MGELIVSVRKLTDVELMREACSMTFDGESHASLKAIYKSEHSPARTQMFWITLKNIKLAYATHLIRHHVGSQPFQLTCRDDRKGGNPGQINKCYDICNQLKEADKAIRSGELGIAQSHIYSSMEEIEWLANNADRNTPVNLGMFVNAQALIDMAKLRLCNQAHKETIAIFKKIKEAIRSIDPDLANMMVVKCVYRGGLCGEPRCCGFNNTKAFIAELKEYVSLFSEKQIGIINTLNLKEQE